jgi:hypothetical protein
VNYQTPKKIKKKSKIILEVNRQQHQQKREEGEGPPAQ